MVCGLNYTGSDKPQLKSSIMTMNAFVMSYWANLFLSVLCFYVNFNNIELSAVSL